MDDKIEILAERMDEFKSTLEKLNKQALKVGHPEIFAKVIGEEIRPGETEDTHYKVVIVHVTGETPMIEGWTFVAAIDHFYGQEAESIVRTVPGESVPTKYHSTGAVCDHCGYVRQRKGTIILRDKDGNYLQVGSTCVRDFTGAGYEPARLITFCTDAWETIRQCGEHTTGMNIPPMWKVEKVVSVAVAIVRLRGWLSKTKAYEINESRHNNHVTPTAEHVAYFLNQPWRGAPTSVMEEWRKFVGKHNPTEADIKEAQQLIEACPIDEVADNDFENNLRTIVRMKVVAQKHFGILCAIARKVSNTPASTRKSQHIGKVGEKLPGLRCLVAGIRTYQNQYGTGYVVKLLANGEDHLVWFASNTYFKEGDTVMVKGTIKAHEEFNGTAQTVLTRCKLTYSKDVKECDGCHRHTYTAEHTIGDFCITCGNRLVVEDDGSWHLS